MSKQFNQLKKEEKELILKVLVESAKRMPGEYPAESFVNELLTESEKLTLGRRILIAQMLLAGETYFEIQNKLAVSPNTINISRQWLVSQIPDYAKTLETAKQKAKEKREERSKKYQKGRPVYQQYPDRMSFAGLRHRYPMHFLLFDVAESILKKFDK